VRWASYLPPPPSKRRKPKKRNPLPTIVMGIVGVFAVGIVVALIIGNLNRPSLSDAEAQRARETANAVATQIAQNDTAKATLAPTATLGALNPAIPTATASGNVGAVKESTFALEGYPGYLKTDLCVSAGQTLNVESTGTVRVGEFVGVVGPEGTLVGFMGFALGTTYNLVGQYPHAVVMCRIEGELAWRMCGTSTQFTAANNGCLELQINDNDVTDNSGRFTVKVSVR